MCCSMTFCEEQYLKFQIRALYISGEKLKLVEIVLPRGTMHDVKPFLFFSLSLNMRYVYFIYMHRTKYAR